MLAVGLAALAVVDPPFLHRWEERAQDVILGLVSPVRSESACVIVAADAKSRREVGPWPWPDGTAGRLVERIARGNPRAIGFASCPPSSDGGTVLPDAVRFAGKVAAGFSFRAAGLSSAPALPAPESARIRYVTNPWGKARRYSMPVGEGAECLDDPLSGAAAGAGFLNAFCSARGPVREAPLVCADGSGYFMSFAVALACIASGTERVTLRLTGDAVEGVEIGGRLIPTDARGMLRLRASAWGGSPVISASAVLLGNADPSRWAGKIVLVGECEAPPIRMPGRFPASAPPVIHNAGTLDAILSGNYLRRSRPAAFIEFMLAVLFPFVARRIFGWRGRTWLKWGLLAAVLAGCAGATVALGVRGWEVRPFYPMLSAVVSWAVFEAMRGRKSMHP